MSPMLAYLQNGPLKLALVAVFSWLGLFTLFLSSGFFLRGHEFEHPVNVIPNGVSEKRVFSIATLKSFPLSPSNRLVFGSLESSSYVDLSFDTTDPAVGPRINRRVPHRSYHYSLNTTIARLSVSAHPTAPWSTFGLSPADAVELNNLVYTPNRWQDEITIHTWLGEKTPERHVVYLSLSDTFTPGDEFATVVRTRTFNAIDAWSVVLAPRSRPSATTRALSTQRTLALFLWPVLFRRFLSEGGMAGVVLLWVCFMTAGYACITVMVAQWAVRSGTEGREERRGQGAALRWEEEGWALMNAVADELRQSEQEDHALLLMKD